MPYFLIRNAVQSCYVSGVTRISNSASRKQSIEDAEKEHIAAIKGNHSRGQKD